MQKNNIKENNGFTLVVLLIAVVIIALIFFAKGGALDKFKGSSIKENKEQKEAVELQVEDIDSDLEKYNIKIQEELNN